MDTSRLSLATLQNLMAKMQNMTPVDTHVFGRYLSIQVLRRLLPQAPPSVLKAIPAYSLLGLKVVEDEEVPENEIHFGVFDCVEGKPVKKVTKIFNFSREWPI